MAIKTRQRIQPFNSQQLESIAKILANTSSGLTGTQIQNLLHQCRINDTDPTNTKWKRLFNAFVDFQNQHQLGNHVVVFINAALDPAGHIRNPEVFHQWRSELNGVLSLAGFSINDSGKVISIPKISTLNEALERAARFKSKVERRGVHPDVIKYCATEIATENYFHSVFESMKSITSKIRRLSHLDGDGIELFDQVFSLGTMKEPKSPILAINTLDTATLRGEQRGFLNLLKGLFGTIRNPISHEPKIEWEMPEEDALDIMCRCRSKSA